MNTISEKPPLNKELLVYDFRNGWGVAILRNYGWRLCVDSDDDFSLEEVTHWMELPPNPHA